MTLTETSFVGEKSQTHTHIDTQWYGGLILYCPVPTPVLLLLLLPAVSMHSWCAEMEDERSKRRTFFVAVVLPHKPPNRNLGARLSPESPASWPLYTPTPSTYPSRRMGPRLLLLFLSAAVLLHASDVANGLRISTAWSLCLRTQVSSETQQQQQSSYCCNSIMSIPYHT